jgi:HSP20 family protein
MSLIRRNKNLFPSFSRLWDDDDFFQRSLSNWGVSNFSDAGTTLPAVNISETDDHYEVEMAAPGMKKEDFKIELDNNVLTISSKKVKNAKGVVTKNTAAGNLVINLSSAALHYQKKWWMRKR